MARRNDFVIVTGPGRSGTSAVARVLHESGLRMGDDLLGPSKYNRAGFYEEIPVCKLNDQIFSDCGMESTDVWASRETVLSAALPYRSTMADLAAASTAAGWKDPRFSLTLEAWLPHLPARPRVVLCLRSPEAFVQSSISIFGLASREELEVWWANHLRRALEIAHEYGLDVTSVVYEELVTRPREAVAKLSAFVGKELDPSYVEPALRQFDHAVPPRHAALYEEVRALSEVTPS